MFANQANPNTNPAFGYQYNGMQQPRSKFENILTQEQMQRLMQSENFVLALTEEEKLRGICNHRDFDGTKDALNIDPITREATCRICGYRFRPVDLDLTPEELQKDVDRIVDVLQTIKLLFLDMPHDAAKEYFQIIPLIEKIPKLFECAAKDFTKHENVNWNYYSGNNMGAMSMFQNLQSMFGGGFGGFGGQPNPYQQPYGGQPFAGQPNPAYGAPVNNGAPMYGAPSPTGNPFGYPGANPGYAPNPAVNGYTYAPQQQPMPNTSAPGAQQTAPTAPQAPATKAPEATVTQNVQP